MRLRRIIRAAAVIVVFTFVLLLNAPPFKGRAPAGVNVILLTVDSLRADHLGCYGYHKMTTPNIDAIAEKGALFRRAYSQSAWTFPGLESILTSLQPPVHQVDQRGKTLDPNITTIFDCFREAGYVVPNICFLLTVPEFSSIRIGPVEEKYFHGGDGEEIFHWLDENRNSKFFLWHHYRNVHLPYKPKEGSRSMYFPILPAEGELSPGIKAVLSETAVAPVGTVKFEEADVPVIKGLYDAEVREFDSFFGRLYARLQKYGLLKKTLIVVTADHGEELMDHGFVGHASTMHSATLYDEVMRIPLIMSWSDYLPPAEIREQVQQVDIMPTILDIVGIPVPSGVQGRSLAAMMFDARKRNESSVPVFAETIYGGFQADEEMAKTRLRGVRTDAWKLIETDTPEARTFQLFDLLTDPKEIRNVYDENTQTAAALRTLLSEWKRENMARRSAIVDAGAPVLPGGSFPGCPQMLFPYDGVVLRYQERNGTIRSSWVGSPNSSYVIEYDIGQGVHHLSGSFVTFRNERVFGPYSREIWSALAARNPWRIRVSPDTNPRCWSEWVRLEFE